MHPAMSPAVRVRSDAGRNAPQSTPHAHRSSFPGLYSHRAGLYPEAENQPCHLFGLVHPGKIPVLRLESHAQIEKV